MVTMDREQNHLIPELDTQKGTTNMTNVKTPPSGKCNQNTPHGPKSNKNDKTSGDKELDDYFASVKMWINQYQEQEKQSAEIFSQAFNNASLNFQTLASGHYNSDIYECQLASLWKRFCAECVDHVILTIVQFYIINILHYGFDLSIADYHKFLVYSEMTTEIISIEFISRIMLFLYESYFLSLDYATPGKKIFGLKVVRVTLIVEVQGRETIYAAPCERLGWWHAFSRSILKNLGVLMFPICYGFMLTRYARSGYDYVTKTIVIDISRAQLRLVTPEERANIFVNGIRL